MRPKEYYEQNTIQEDARYVFTLLPGEFEKQYRKYIKEPIEKLRVGDGKVVCSSHTEFEPGVDQLDGIWKSIQKASIVIANITGFKPNVMLELGVALMKKDRVILIADKSLHDKPDIPFNISTLNVDFYEPGKLDEYSERLVTQVEKWITPDEPKIKNPKVIKLMNDVLGLRREKRYEAALLLFESMDGIEPGNWYIYLEWGITFKESNDYENAIKKLQKALEYARANSHKSEIYTELGVIYRENNMVNEALVAFEKAENLDSDNAELYEKWAFLYHNMGKHQEAMNKMTMAVKLDENNEVYKWKFEFYGKKFTDKNFTLGLGKFLALKRDEKRDGRQNYPRPPRYPDRSGQTGYGRRPPQFLPRSNNPENFKRFVNRHKPKEIVEGEITHVDSKGVFVGFEFGIFGRISPHRLTKNFDVNESFKVGERIRVKLLFIKYDIYQIDLDLTN